MTPKTTTRYYTACGYITTRLVFEDNIYKGYVICPDGTIDIAQWDQRGFASNYEYDLAQEAYIGTDYEINEQYDLVYLKPIEPKKIYIEYQREEQKEWAEHDQLQQEIATKRLLPELLVLQKQIDELVKKLQHGNV